MKHLFTLALLFCMPVLATSQDLGNVPLSLSPIESVNSTDNDYAPVLITKRDRLYFTSVRDGNADIWLSARLTQTIESSRRSTEVQIGGSGSSDTKSRSTSLWASPTMMAAFSTSAYEGASSFSADGSTVIFASNRAGGRGDVDLYMADVVDGNFQNIRNLGSEINTEYWESQPSLSNDGKLLFFASNRPDGVGGTDIWLSRRRNDGSWSAAECLDRSINTERDERTPFLTSDGGTLVFASSGHAGFGGYDLFYSTRDMDNQRFDWTQPTNLGGIINSERDELFFYSAAAGEYFYISSSRNKDRGLDIYQGTPNLLAFGTQRIDIAVLDSLSGNPLPSTVIIYDIQSGAPVASISTTADQLENTIALPANRAYRVEASVAGYPKRSIDLQAMPANNTQHARLAFGTVGFDFSAYQIPFFVTGYYRPNTSSNLAALADLRKTDLAEANYIERFSPGSKTQQRYEGYAKIVDELFQSVVRSAVDTLFPRFRSGAQSDEVLEIVVTGYADPKPILGRYVESQGVRFFDVPGNSQTVETGDRLTNLSLSGLRSVHSARELQRMMEIYSAQQGRDDFNSLLSANRLRFKCVGGGVNTASNDFAAQRRIKIDFTRLSNGSTKSEFDSNSLTSPIKK